MAPSHANILKLEDTTANEVIRYQADPQMPLCKRPGMIWEALCHTQGLG